MTANGQLFSDQQAQVTATANNTKPPKTPADIVNEQIQVLTQQIALNNTLSSLMTQASTISAPNFTNYLPSQDQLTLWISQNNQAITNNNQAITYFQGVAGKATPDVAAFLNQYINTYLTPYGIWLVANGQFLSDEQAQVTATKNNTPPPQSPEYIVHEQIQVLNQQIVLNNILSNLMTTAGTIIVPNAFNYLLSNNPADAPNNLASFIPGNEQAIANNKKAIDYFTGQESLQILPYDQAILTFLQQYVSWLQTSNATYLNDNQQLLEDELAQYTVTPAPHTPEYIMNEEVKVLQEQVASDQQLLGLMQIAETTDNAMSSAKPLSSVIDKAMAAPGEVKIELGHQWFSGEVRNYYVGESSSGEIPFLEFPTTVTLNMLKARLTVSIFDNSGGRKWQDTIHHLYINLPGTSGVSIDSIHQNVSRKDWQPDGEMAKKLQGVIRKYLAGVELKKGADLLKGKRVVLNQRSTGIFLLNVPDGTMFSMQFLDWQKRKSSPVLVSVKRTGLKKTSIGIKGIGSVPGEHGIRSILDNSGKEMLRLTAMDGGRLSIVAFDRLFKFGNPESVAIERVKADAAMLGQAKKDLYGGIDLTKSAIPLELRNTGGTINFNIDTAQLKSVMLASGLTSQVFAIKPLKSLPEFLGITN